MYVSLQTMKESMQVMKELEKTYGLNFNVQRPDSSAKSTFDFLSVDHNENEKLDHHKIKVTSQTEEAHVCLSKSNLTVLRSLGMNGRISPHQEGQGTLVDREIFEHREKDTVNGNSQQEVTERKHTQDQDESSDDDSEIEHTSITNNSFDEDDRCEGIVKTIPNTEIDSSEYDDDNDHDLTLEVDWDNGDGKNHKNERVQKSGLRRAWEQESDDDNCSEESTQQQPHSFRSNEHTDNDKNIEIVTKYREMMQELGVRIVLQEKLLQNLQTAQNELQKQKELYENRLLQEKHERDKVLTEREALKQRLKELESQQSDAHTEERTQHQERLKVLQSKLVKMEKIRSSQQRAEQDRRRAELQIEALKQNIQDAKSERKRLMDHANAEIKKNQELAARQGHQVRRLQKDLEKEKIGSSKKERILKNKEARIMRTVEENLKLKQQLKDNEKQMQELRHELLTIRATREKTSSRLTANVSNKTKQHSEDARRRRDTYILSSQDDFRDENFQAQGSRQKRMSQRTVQIEAERKRAKLDKEIAGAVLYQTVKSRIEELVQRRDQELPTERHELQRELDLLSHTDNGTVSYDKEDTPLAQRIRELNSDLEGIETETHLLTKEIQENERSLLSMEYQGIRACLSMDDISEEGDSIIQSTTLKEAHTLLRSLFSALVRRELAAERIRVRVKQLELEAEAKTAVLHSLASAPISTAESEVAPLDSEGKPAGKIEGMQYEYPPGVQNIEVGSNQCASRIQMNAENVRPKECASNEFVSRPRSNTYTFNEHASNTSNIPLLAAVPHASSAGTLARTSDSPTNERVDFSIAQRQVERSTSSSSKSSSVELKSSLDTRRKVVSSSGKHPRYSRSTEAVKNKLRSEPEFSGLQTSLRTQNRPRQKKVINKEVTAERIGSSDNRNIVCNTHTISGHVDQVMCLETCQSKLISGSKDKTAMVWDLGLGKHQQTLSGHEAPVRALASLQTHFLTVCRNVVRVWDLRTCEEMDRFTLRKDNIQDIQVGAEGTYLYAAAGRSLRIWDLRMKREVKNFAHRGKIEALSLHNSGTKLALATIDHKVRVFDIPDIMTGPLSYQVRPKHHSRSEVVKCTA